VGRDKSKEHFMPNLLGENVCICGLAEVLSRQITKNWDGKSQICQIAEGLQI
jgi:hypothetical protein